ncbi:outer membrane protein assembly factor BamB family protein [Stratiformator vulcanicus]|uniref:Outer membrane biogenesis protein BamB n=1 Tax=Stratiformator vulcanicus TaxID=2527980 RepID=A0A517R2H1_9PLAN|nr:PQQ-binding-like beta-propeller repeat protein [Stratiformator vulcanicus]QDT38086.1 outer membrane biogenesis protein BamB [Stratiformator vulcanicus]
MQKIAVFGDGSMPHPIDGRTTFGTAPLRVTLAVLAGVFLLASEAICQLGADPPPQQEPEPASNSNGDRSPFFDTLPTRPVDSMLVFERQDVLAISEARIALQQDNDVNAVRVLQNLLSRPVDSFVDRRPDKTIVGASRQAEAMVLQLVRSKPGVYELFAEPEAKSILATDDDASMVRRWRQVAAEYFLTAAGFEVVDHLASRAFDRGEFDLAARLWLRLVNEAAHRNRCTSTTYLKFSLAMERCGRGGEISEFEVGPPQNFGNLTGPVAAPNSEFNHPIAARGRMLATHPRERNDDEWLQSSVQIDRCRRRQCSIPWLDPRLTIHASDVTRGSYGRGGSRSNSGETPATCNLVIVGDTICWTSRSGLTVGISAQTGAQVWRHERAACLSAKGSDQFTSAFECIASDGRRLFLFDSADESGSKSLVVASASDHAVEATPPRKASLPNCLVAVDLQSASDSEIASEAWSLDLKAVAVSAATAPRDAANLNGYFSSPPVVSDGQLFVLAEVAGEQNLVVVSAASGEILCVQPLGYSDGPHWNERGAGWCGNSLSVTAGIVICGVGKERVVAVDAITGHLLWGRSLDDQADGDGFGHSSRRRSASETPVVNMTVADGRVITVSPSTREIVCLEATSGREHWRVPAEDIERFLCISDGVLLVAGARRCRGMLLADGSTLWERRLGRASGRGMLCEDGFIMPAVRGGIVVIDVSTGRTREVAIETPGLLFGAEVVSRGAPITLGNFAYGADRIVSATAGRLDVFEPAGVMFSNLASNDPQAASNEQRLKLAAIALSLDRFDLAEEALSVSDKTEQAFSDPSLRHLRREVGLRRLRTSPRDLSRQVELLLAQSSGRAERLEISMAATNAAISGGDLSLAIESLEDLIRVERSDSLRLDPNDRDIRRSHLATAIYFGERIRTVFGQDGESAIERLCATLCDQAVVPKTALRFSTHFDPDGLVTGNTVLAELRNAFTRHDLAECDRLLAQMATTKEFSNHFREFSVRLAAARSECRHSARLLSQVDPIIEEEPRQYEPVSAVRFASATVSAERPLTKRPLTARVPTNRGSVVDRLAHADRTALRQALAERKFFAGVTTVEIEPLLWDESRGLISNVFSTQRRRLSTRPGDRYQILDIGEAHAPELAVIDLMDGATRCRIRTNSNFRTALRFRPTSGVGVLPVATAGRIMGVSLAGLPQDRPLWSVEVGDRITEQPHLGAFGPDFCIYQTRCELGVLDPTDGSTRWVRSGGECDSGLLTDQYAGLAADSHTVTTFGSDRRQYTVYATATGDEIDHGVLPIDLSRQRRPIGRKLFYVAKNPDGLRARLWDPKFGCNDIDEPIDARETLLMASSSNADTLLLLTEDGRLRSFDTATGTPRWQSRIAVEEAEQASSLRMFRQGTNLYVNIQSPQRGDGPYDHYYVNDSFLPVSHVQGLLIAFEAESGRELWRRRLPQTSFVSVPDLDLPVLIAVSRLRNRSRRSSVVLGVEVIDAADGEVLAESSNIISDRLVMFRPDAENRSLDLLGLRSGVRLRFK